MSRTRLRCALLLIAAVALLCVAVFRRPLRIAYHQWRMNAAYNTLSGDPQPMDDILAWFDETGVAVNPVFARYTRHRQALVDLGVLSQITVRFPHLYCDAGDEQFSKCSAFMRRMQDRFPGHKHFYLDGQGTFGTWVPVAERQEWETFIDAELLGR